MLQSMPATHFLTRLHTKHFTHTNMIIKLLDQKQYTHVVSAQSLIVSDKSLF